MESDGKNKTPERCTKNTDSTGNPSNDIYHTPEYLQQKRVELNEILSNISPNLRPTKVINPFEAALADRYHLPLIDSPSLFQRPATPPFSSTKFEWTIEDVSSLNPVNVETSLNPAQFTSDTDPVLEEKTQAAIKTFFKENLQVPSPLDCALRKHKIVFHNQSPSSFINNISKKRDAECQTELTLPPIIPENIENVLKPYISYLHNQQQILIEDEHDRSIIDYDASLRRKLFDVSLNKSTDNELSTNDLIGLSPPPASPKINSNKVAINFCGTPSSDEENVSMVTANYINDSSFGLLSPISKLSTIPTNNITLNPIKNRRRSLNIVDSVSSFHRSLSTPPDNRISTGSCLSKGSFKIHKSSGSKRPFDKYDDYDCETTSNKNKIDTDNIMNKSDVEMTIENSFHVTTPVRKKPRHETRKNLTHSFRNESELINSSNQSKDEFPISIRLDFKQKSDSGYSDIIPPPQQPPAQ